MVCLSEEANRLIRERTVATSTSRCSRLLTDWATPHERGLIADYGLTELQHAATDGSKPATWAPFFESDQMCVSMASATDDMVDTVDTVQWSEWQKRIAELPSRSSTSQTPAQEMEAAFAFAFALRWMETHDTMEGASTAWWSELIPKHSFVSQSVDSITEHYFVLHTTEYAALACPAVMEGNGMVQLKSVNSRYKWLYATAANSVKVHRTTWTSPLHNHSEGRDAVVSLQAETEPISMLLWQVEHGFPNISESCLKRLHDHYDLEIPQASGQKELAYKQVLRMSMIHGIESEYTHVEALRSIQRCWAIEHPSESHEGILPDEICQDILLPEDKEQVKVQLQTARVAREFKRRSAAVFTHGLESYDWKPGHTPTSGKPVKRKARPEYKGKDIEELEQFLWNQSPQTVGVGICCDESNGRFQLSYKGITYSRKSVSWDKRGQALCAKESLDWLWDTHFRQTRERPPWHSD
eukprot:4363435-Amphidinium_carterae.1